MQVLFLWDAHGTPDEAMARQLVADASDSELTRKEALDAARGTWENKESIDAWVERLAPKWPPRRQPPVDRNLLRLAVWELTHSSSPPKVVIDEAIELAKQFSTEQSASFINGVLDAVLREHRSATQIAQPPPDEGPKGEA